MLRVSLVFFLRDGAQRTEDMAEAPRCIYELEEWAEGSVRGEQTLESSVAASKRGEVDSSVEGVSIALD